MSKKTMKILSIMLVAILMMGMVVTPVFASDFVDYKPQPKDDTNASTAVQTTINAILSVVQSVAIGVAVIMLIVLAIKYISSAPNDKAEIKKHAVVYIVGAVILFASTGILEIIKAFAANVHN